jgi:dihydrofolate reductase
MLTLIAATDRNNAMGCSRNAPWSSVADLEFFFRETTGGLLIMDRDTYEKYPSSDFFFNRKILVVDPDNSLVTRYKQTHSVQTLKDAVRSAWLTCRPRVYVIGSSEIYAQALPFANRILLSEASVPVIEPTEFFPDFDDQLDWGLVNTWLLECPNVPQIKEYFRKPLTAT